MLGITTRLKQAQLQKLIRSKALTSKGKRSSEQGLTLIECLVAILIVTGVIAAITPGIFLTLATRVQNRRASQAMQLAQAEVDTVRRIVEQGTYTRDRLPPSVGNGNISDADAPADPIWNREVDLNTDRSNNPVNKFRVQTFRTNGTPDPTNPNKPVAFNLGVRVYVALPGQTFERQRASLGLTTAYGSQARRPLAVLYTPITLSDNENSLSTLCQSVPGGGAGNCP